MTTRPRRVARRLLEVFDYRTFVVATGFLVLLLVGYLVVASLNQAQHATSSADQRGRAASRRIDLLNKEILALQAQIAAGRDERGQLAAKVDALAEQVRRMGGAPIVTVTVSSAPARTAPPSPQPRPSVTAQPRPTRTRTPSPTPSPTCTRLLGILC